MLFKWNCFIQWNAFFFIAGYLHRKETVLGGSFQIPLPLPYHPIVIFKTKNKRNQNKSKEENNYQWSVVTTTDKTETHAKVTSLGGGGGGGVTPLFALSGYVPLNRVWFSGPWGSNRALNTLPFWAGSPSKNLKIWDEWSTCGPTFFIPKYIVWYMAKITYPGCTGSSSRSVEYALLSSSWINM